MDISTAEQVRLMSEQSMITLFGITFNIYAVILLSVILIVLYAIKRAQDDPESDFDWADLFTSIDQASGKRKASVTKILQIVGGITGTFIVIKLTLQNNIGFEIFATYLAYVASIEGFSKFMIAKYGSGEGRGRGSYSGQDFGSGYDRYDRYPRRYPDRSRYDRRPDRGHMDDHGYEQDGQYTDPNDPDLPAPKPIEPD